MSDTEKKDGEEVATPPTPPADATATPPEGGEATASTEGSGEATPPTPPEGGAA